MKILVTNDDGINATGMWTLVKALKKYARVVVAAPDRERSATGTAVTLRQPLKVQQVTPLVPNVEAYALDGTPSDSVILGLTKLANHEIELVVSGINHGPNVGDDVLISGTVGAALQGYLHGLSAMAVSVDSWENPSFDVAAELAALLVRRIQCCSLGTNIFLNVNVPNLPLKQIKGLEITRLAHLSHTHSVKEEGSDKEGYYRLLRDKVSTPAEEGTDIWALEQGIISITPLRINLVSNPSALIPDSLYSDLLNELLVER